MDNKAFNDKLEDLLFDLATEYDHKFGSPELLKASQANIKQLFTDLLVGQGWYYYDPDELGEDAFVPLGKAEIKAALK